MELAEIVSYAATLFMLAGYLCRTVWLRVFTLLGCTLNALFAWMIIDQSLSARSIIVSNAIYAAINFVQLFREIKRKRNGLEQDKK